MGVTPAELEANDGKFVTITDFTGQVYEGVLHYMPLEVQFPIQIWTNDCCFITFIAIDDVETLKSGLTCFKVPCCDRCLPEAIIMRIGTNEGCSCLAHEAYILEWDNINQKYEFNYPAICGCSTFHAELVCLGNSWVCYLSLRNKAGLTCADGIHLNFPINCDTLKGTDEIDFTQTGTCGTCVSDIITVSFYPIE